MKTITGKAAVTAFLAEKGQRDAGPHKFNRQVCHWPYCSRCGLVRLKNERSRREARKTCVVYV